MGRPEEPERYCLIQCDNVEVYLSLDIWQRIQPPTEKILIALEGYGRFWLWLTE